MKFTESQIAQLFLRLRQTKEELLYDFAKNKVNKFAWTPTGGKILGVAYCDYLESAWSYPSLSDLTVQSGQVDDRVAVWVLLDVLPEVKGVPKFDTLLLDREQSFTSDVPEDLAYNWTFGFSRAGMSFSHHKATKELTSAFRNTTGMKQGKVGAIEFELPDGCGPRLHIGSGRYETKEETWVDLEECAKQVESFALFAKQYAATKFPLEFTDPFADDDIGALADLPCDSDVESVRNWLRERRSGVDTYH